MPSIKNNSNNTKKHNDCRGEKKQQGNTKHKVIAVEEDRSKETTNTRGLPWRSTAARKQITPGDCRGENQQQGNKKHKVITADTSKETKKHKVIAVEKKAARRDKAQGDCL